MKVVATFHGPTSVSHSLKCRLTPELEYLVIARTHILEVFALLPEALTLLCTFDIWNKISSLQSVNDKTLIVTTDHPDPKLLFLEYIPDDGFKSGRLVCFHSLSLLERSSRPTEFFSGCLVDHKGTVAVVGSYVGRLKILELDDGRLTTEFDVSIRELNVISICFLLTSNPHSTTLAILYRDHLQSIILASRDLTIAERELSTSSISLPEIKIPDTDSSLIIPVPPYGRVSWNTTGGLLVLGGRRIMLYALDRKQKQSDPYTANKTKGSKLLKAQAEWSFVGVSACVCADEDGTRYLLSDNFGHLVLLAINRQEPRIDLLALGTISPPTTLTLLSSQYVYVGSHFGDSQLIRVAVDSSSSDGSFIDVAESYSNIAPIMDAVIADTDDGVQPAIVTCSGGRNSGSLRIIRSGANFTTDTLIEGIVHATQIFRLKVQFEDQCDAFLLISTPVTTCWLRLHDAWNEKGAITQMTELDNLLSDSPTLAARNILTRSCLSNGRSTYENGPYAIQVIPKAVMLLNMDIYMVVAQWVPEQGQEIILADISPSQICVALSGGTVVLLHIIGNDIKEQSRKTFFGGTGSPFEVSALTLSQPDTSMKYAQHVILGFWLTNEVKVFTLPSFAPTGDVVKVPQAPRSLLLFDFGLILSESMPHLLIGLIDGSVCVVLFQKGKFSEKSTFTLGDSVVSLAPCNVDGRPAVFASSTRSVLFFWNKDALSYSTILTKDVLAMSALHSSTYPLSVIIASHDGLLIGRVLELNKLHIRTIPMGLDNPIRIAYHPKAKVFGLGCLRVDTSNPNMTQSIFRIVDAVTYAVTHDYPLNLNEEITAVATIILDSQSMLGMCFAVGSMYLDDMDQEPRRGRILLFVSNPDKPSLENSHGPYLLTTADVDGCVYAINNIAGKIVAAVNTGVVLFEMSTSNDNSPKLNRLAEWNHNYLVTNIVVSRDYIVIGDAVSSVAVLKIVDNKFVNVARDFAPLWPLCIEVVDGETIIGANCDNNIFSYKMQRSRERLSLERDGYYHIGETVNKFVPGRLSAPNNETSITPKQLYLTSSGRIGVVADVDDSLAFRLSSLQRNIANVIHGPGNIDHTMWRAPINSRGRSDAQSSSFGFLDGDLLEQFLNYSATSPEIIQILAGKNEAEKLDLSYAECRSLLESLRNIH